MAVASTFPLVCVVKNGVVDAVKTVQMEMSQRAKRRQTGLGKADKTLSSGEAVTSLCTAVEAIFLHGIKERSILRKLSKSGSLASLAHSLSPPAHNLQRLPTVSAWDFLLIISHKETLQKIESLSQIRTDVGRMRAWVRLVINEGSLVNYLEAARRDLVSLRKNYERYALLRCQDTLDIVINFLRGLESCAFDIPQNSFLLNNWQTPALVMAGLWAAPEDEGAETGRDIVNELAEIEIAQAEFQSAHDALVATVNQRDLQDNPGIRPVLSVNGGFHLLNRGFVTEDEALRVILTHDSPVSGSTRSSTPKNSPLVDYSAYENEYLVMKGGRDLDQKPVDGDKQPCEGGECDREGAVAADPPASTSSPVVSETPDTDRTTSEDELIDSTSTVSDVSFYARHISHEEDIPHPQDYSEEGASGQILLDQIIKEVEDEHRQRVKATRLARQKEINEALGHDTGELSATETLFKLLGPPSTPYLSGFIHAWNPFGSFPFFDTCKEKTNKGDDALKIGFSLQDGMSIASLSVTQSQQMMKLFDKIPIETGIDDQNFRCSDCTKACGGLFGKSYLCEYTKKHYCDDCHKQELSIIPIRVFLSWDFTKREVCVKAKIFLDSIFNEPVLDPHMFNMRLIEFVPDLEAVLYLRKQISFIRAYLETCRHREIKKKILSLVSPKEYLYDRVDVYSLQDLLHVKTGQLKALLEKVVSTSETHIYACVICSGRGYICEVCGANQAIFPFHLDDIVQCQACFQAFHMNCSKELVECPRCERRNSQALNQRIEERRFRVNMEREQSAQNLSVVEKVES